jgi:hypothetical protein
VAPSGHHPGLVARPQDDHWDGIGRAGGRDDRLTAARRSAAPKRALAPMRASEPALAPDRRAPAIVNDLLELDIEPDLTEISRAREFVARSLAPGPVDGLFMVAVSELVTNAVEEHRRIGATSPITIAVDPGASTVRITDRGRGFAPADSRPSEPLAARGRGLHIARTLAPGLTWEPGPAGGTIVTLRYAPDARGSGGS